MNKIYFDNAATTALDPAAHEVLMSALNQGLGNPSSLHRAGVKANMAMEQAREVVAGSIGAESDEIYFTSGGTESNNLAIVGYCLANRDKGRHLIVSSIEHPSVLEPARWLEESGFELSILPVDYEGRVDPETLQKQIREDTVLVSIMHANNEVGTVQDINVLGAVCEKNGVLFHVDASQSFVKIPVDVNSAAIGLLTLSSHKAHGPRGVGALFKRKNLRLSPLFRGGGQENGLRPGTPAPEAIAAFAKAVHSGLQSDGAQLMRIRDHLLGLILGGIEGAELNGPIAGRLPNNLNFFIPGLKTKELLHFLDKKGVSVSAGSACSSGKTSPSHVLLAMGYGEERSKETLRISLSRFSTMEEADSFFSILSEGVGLLRGDRR